MTANRSENGEDTAKNIFIVMPFVLHGRTIAGMTAPRNAWTDHAMNGGESPRTRQTVDIRYEKASFLASLLLMHAIH